MTPENAPRQASTHEQDQFDLAKASLPAGFSNREDFAKALEARLEQWMNTYDDPDEDIIGGLEPLSPRKIYEQVKNRTAEGDKMIDDFAELYGSREEFENNALR